MTRPGHWPTPDGLRILRIALLDGEPVSRGWEAILQRLDLDTLDEGSTRLIPLVEKNLRKHELVNPWSDRMRGVYRYWWAHNQLLLGRLGVFLGALDEAGVPTIVLKGAAVAARYYDDPSLRPMNDADVLVPRDSVRDALAVAARLNLTPEARVDDEFMRLRHGVSLRDAGGNTIDLHWAIHEDDARPGADDAAWTTAVPVDIAGVRTRMLAPAPLLLHACAHGAKWAADPGIRWVADATLIIRRGDVDWPAVVAEAEHRHFVVRLRSCLAYLRVALGVEVPTEALDQLAAAPVSVFERMEHQIRVRRHATFGELPRYWFAWLRTRGDTGIWDLRPFGRYLQHAWGLDSARDVPAALAERASARLAGRVPTAPVARGPRPTIRPAAARLERPREEGARTAAIAADRTTSRS